jgi:hypothetical protein
MECHAPASSSPHIGFDAFRLRPGSRNPKRDIPIGILGSLDLHGVYTMRP